MSKLNEVMDRVHSGADVRVVLSPYGQKKIEVTRGWLPIPRRFHLSRDEITLVEVALNARTSRRKVRTKIKD